MLSPATLAKVCLATVDRWVYMPSPDGKIEAYVGQSKLGRVLVGRHGENIEGRVVLDAPPLSVTLTPQETENAMIKARASLAR